MTEEKVITDLARAVKCRIGDVDIRIVPRGNEGGSAPTEVYIVAEGPPEKVTWRPVESKTFDDVIEEAKEYAAQWIGSGMPSSGYYGPIDLSE